MPITLTQLNEDEALRYMGCPPEKADAPLRALVAGCAREVLAAARPRWAWRALGLTLSLIHIFLSTTRLPERRPMLRCAKPT